MGRMEGSDAAVVARVRAGEAEAFRLLVERHSGSLFRLAYRMTGNERDAEDVVQDAFLKAYRRLDRFESRANFGTWIYRIAINCALDFRRARKPESQQRAPEREDRPALIQSLPTDSPTPEQLTYGSEVQRRVAIAMARLTPRERAAFVLRHFEGKSTEEIGAALGLRASAAKNTVFRAVQKLRTALEPVVSSIR